MRGEGLSMELASGAVTAMSGLPADGVCLHGGRALLSDGVALYRVGGDSDDGAPIPVRLTLAPIAAGGPARLAAVALEGVVGGRAAILAASETGEEVSGESGSAGSGGLPGRAVCRLGRGHGRVWSVSLDADDGAALDIAAVEPCFVLLDRRP